MCYWFLTCGIYLQIINFSETNMSYLPLNMNMNRNAEAFVYAAELKPLQIYIYI